MALGLAGCATGSGKLRQERDGGLEEGDFLAALEHSRALYRSDALLTDLAAHCGLVFAVSQYAEARECVEHLIGRIEQAELSLEADLQLSLPQALRRQHHSGGPRKPFAVASTLGAGVFADGKLQPGWRATRYGIEAVLVLHNLKWRALYVRGLVALQTGDPRAARVALLEAQQIVLRSWSTGEDSLTLAALLEGREEWRHHRMSGAGSDDARAWWIDLLGALAIASSAANDGATAAQAIGELQQLDVPRRLQGYQQSRLAFAHYAAGNLARAKLAAEADPEQFRRTLRVGGGLLSGGMLLAGVLAASGVAAVPAATLTFANIGTALSYFSFGLTGSVLTLTASRIAGQDTSWDRAQRWYAVARISHAAGDDRKADALYRKLLKNEEILKSQPGIQWQVYADVAERHEAAGRSDEAIELYQKAVDVIEATRRNIGLESAKIGFVADKQRVYQRLIRLLLQRGLPRAAFELSEQARARALLDVLASRDWSVSSDERLAQQGELIREIDARESEARLAILQDSPREATRRYSAIQHLSQRVQAQDPQLAALTYVKRYRTEEIQQQLLAGEVLLSFVPVGDEWVAFALSRTALYHWQIPAGQVSGHVGLLRHAIAQHSVTPAVTRTLAELLFAGLPQLGEFDRLTIVPTGLLHALPFSTLQDDGGPLPRSVAIRLLPSASALPLLHVRSTAPAAMRIAAFGNPDFGGLLPTLPNSETEVRSVTEIVGSGTALTGREASTRNVRRLASESTVLHFATHGWFDTQRPLQSALYLSDGRGGIEALTASDFYGMRIAARLVTLSACETGLGSVRSGDEVIGLYRGLMFAGANTIVASLWDVDDQSTSFLMTRFYAHLQGVPAPQALRLAQRDTAARWADPYHWAGFAVIGLDDPFAPATDLNRSPAAAAPAH